MALLSCEKQTNDPLTSEELTGNWIVAGADPPELMFNNLYCNAFQLRRNNALVIYYWNRDNAISKNSTSRWRLENGNELVLEFGVSEERCTITQFNGARMTIEHALTSERYVLTKRWRRY